MNHQLGTDDSRDANSLDDLIAEARRQTRAKRKSDRCWHYVEHNGREMHLVDLHIATRVPYSTLTWRYRRGLRGAELIAPPNPLRTRKVDRQ